MLTEDRASGKVQTTLWPAEIPFLWNMIRMYLSVLGIIWHFPFIFVLTNFDHDYINHALLCAIAMDEDAPEVSACILRRNETDFVPEISAQMAPVMGGSASFRGVGHLRPFPVVARDTLAGGDGRDTVLGSA